MDGKLLILILVFIKTTAGNLNSSSTKQIFFEKENELIMNTYTVELMKSRNVDQDFILTAEFTKELLIHSLTDGNTITEKNTLKIFNDLADTMIMEIPKNLKLYHLGDYTDSKSYLKAVRILNKRDSDKNKLNEMKHKDDM